jgi:hypothetical protein
MKAHLRIFVKDLYFSRNSRSRHKSPDAGRVGGEDGGTNVMSRDDRREALFRTELDRRLFLVRLGSRV